MVGSRVGGHVAVKIVAERKLPGISPILWDIGVLVLFLHGLRSAREPSRMTVTERACGWIARVCQRGISINPRIGAKVAVESVVLLEDDDHVVHRALDDRCRPRVRSRRRHWFGFGRWD